MSERISNERWEQILNVIYKTIPGRIPRRTAGGEFFEKETLRIPLETFSRIPSEISLKSLQGSQ